MSDERKVQVSVEARIESLLQGMNLSQEKVASSTAAMTTSVEAMAASVTSGLKRITEEAALTGERFEGLTSKFSKVSGAFLAVGAALAGGEMFEKMIGHTAELAEHLEVVSQKSGLTTQEIQKLDYAAKMCEVSAETLEKGMQKLAVNMNATAEGGTSPASKAFEELKVKVTGAHEELRPIKDVLMDLADKFKGMHAGAKKSADAVAIFGKQGGAMIPFLNKGREGIAELSAEAEKLGVVMDEKGIQTSLAYSEGMKKLKTEAEGLMQKLAVELMPALTAIAGVMEDAGKDGTALNLVFQALGAAVKGIATAVMGLKLVFDSMYQISMAQFDNMITEAKALGTAIKQAWGGDFEAASKTANAAIAETEKRMDDVLNKLTKEAENTKKSFDEMWGFTDAPPAKKAATTDDDDKDDGKDKAKDRLAAFREHLQQMEDARADDQQMSKTEIAAYWKNILDTERLSAKERIEVYHQYVAERRAAEKEEATAAKAAAKQKAEVAKLQDEGELGHAQAGFAQKKSLLDAQVASHQITADQRLQIEKKLLDQEYALEMAALQKKLLLEAEDPVKRQQVLNQIAKLEDKYQSDKLKLATETAKKEETVWDQMYKRIGQSAQQNLDAMIHGTESFGQAAGNVAKSIADSFIQMGEQMMVKWITDMATGAASSKTSAASEITANAGVAATAAMASVAAIPIVGWAMAPGVGASTEAMALGYLGNLASAAGGYDIPAGVNPLVQTHAEEMILPAGISNMFRGMAKSGGTPGGGHTINNIYALDGMSVERVLRNNPEGLGRGIRGAVRNGSLQKR
ncbi:MAG TPA: hypothetical protein VFF76_04520 [Holophagaceae bacterium]|jgi:hypothetical protein|nr:hypothetical protein [Holophagaceae bacterium]